VSGRVLSSALALLGGLLLASPARAQDPSPVPQAAAPEVVQAPPPIYYAPPPVAAPQCGNGYCEAWAGEDAENCPLDCLRPSAPQPQPERGFSAKLYAGPAYQRVFSDSIPGADIGVFLGGVRGSSGWYGGFELFFGQLDSALFTYALRQGATWEARLGRVHLGVGFDFILLGVQRATTGSFMTSGGVGGSLFGTVDLVQGARNALFLGATIRAELIAGADASGNAPAFWGPSAMLGWRYF
jgi:hypothetical protein